MLPSPSGLSSIPSGRKAPLYEHQAIHELASVGGDLQRNDRSCAVADQPRRTTDDLLKERHHVPGHRLYR
jgi:hypothetical protein